MGREAETLALDALPQQLGVGLRMWILDRRDEDSPDNARRTVLLSCHMKVIRAF